MLFFKIFFPAKDIFGIVFFFMPLPANNIGLPVVKEKGFMFMLRLITGF